MFAYVLLLRTLVRPVRCLPDSSFSSLVFSPFPPFSRPVVLLYFLRLPPSLFVELPQSRPHHLPCRSRPDHRQRRPFDHRTRPGRVKRCPLLGGRSVLDLRNGSLCVLSSSFSSTFTARLTRSTFTFFPPLPPSLFPPILFLSQVLSMASSPTT
jgi:hypothetical protein